MNVVFAEPFFPSSQREFVRALAVAGATVTGVGEPVVRFVNRYRAAPARVADRVFVSCGSYEPLIIRNRSMVPTFEAAGMDVRYAEARDGHSWENWRDRLQEGLSWIFPGAQKLFYE